MKDYFEMKEMLVEKTQELFRAGLFAVTSGNLSVFEPEEKIILITPSCYPYLKMKGEDIVLIRLDGTIVEGKHKPSSEWRLHAAIYRNRPDITACVHTHSPYATALAVNRKPLPNILAEMVYAFGGGVPIAPFAWPGTDEVGTGVVNAIGSDKYACLMANHGAVAVGDTLDKACDRAYYLEDAAKIYSYAVNNGEITYFDEK